MGEMFGPIIRQCELTLLRRGGGQSETLSPDSEAMTEGEDHQRDCILEVETEKTQKEIDEEIKRKKEKQRFLDDVGVLTAMVTITLIAVLVVLIKVLIVRSEVRKLHLIILTRSPQQ